MKSQHSNGRDGFSTASVVSQWLTTTSSTGLGQILINHAIAGGDKEVCGYIDSNGHVWPMQNCSVDPEHYFAMDIQAILDLYERVAPATIEAVYHSHPNGPAEWSKRDQTFFPPNLDSVLIAKQGEGWHILVSQASERC